MMIVGENCQTAWENVVSQLTRRNGRLAHVMVEIENPCQLNADWYTRFNPKEIRVRGVAGDSFQDVVNTIFPVKLASRILTRQELYARYLRTHLRRGRLGGKKKDQWGTYFQRLCAFDTLKNLRDNIDCRNSLEDVLNQYLEYYEQTNQVERIIRCLTNWTKPTNAALYCHISSPCIDSPRRLGSPCLQYIQFSRDMAGVVDMSVVYRNHDYFNKAFSNFVGLGQLLKFICDESGRTPGRLYCHSMQAYYDVPKSKMLELVNK